MDNKKFEQLIDLIINEGNEEQARELFHDIVVEKSREIYESIMDEEMMEAEHDAMEEGMGGQVGDLLDEINAEEAGGMTEAEDGEADIEFDDEAEEDGKDLTKDMEKDHDEEGDLEDRVVKIEDKLDELMAEFEEIMAGEEAEEEEMPGIHGDEEMDVEVTDEEMMEATDEEVMEAVQLQKVSVTHGDNGVQTKSPVAANAGQAGMASHPVKASTETETGRPAPAAKDVEGAAKFKNAPGHKGQDLGSTPKPVTKDAATGTKSPVAK